MSDRSERVVPVGTVADFRGRDLDCDGLFLGSDGQVYPASARADDVPAFGPSSDHSSGARIVFVNGVLTPAEAEIQMCRSLADATGAEVVALHNGTSGDALVDGLQCLGDKGARVLHEFGLPYRNDATASVVHLVEDAIESGTPINLFGHSQGGLILSSALTEVSDRLRDQGADQDEIAAKLSVVHVQTFGGAAWSYPDGLDYYHHVNSADPVPDFTGLGAFDVGHVFRDALLGHALPEQLRHVIGEAEQVISGRPHDRVVDDYARVQTFDHPEPWFHSDGAFDLQAHSARLYFDHLRDDPAALGAIANVAPIEYADSAQDGTDGLLHGYARIDDWSAPAASPVPNYANDADRDAQGDWGWSQRPQPDPVGGHTDWGRSDTEADSDWGWSYGNSTGHGEVGGFGHHSTHPDQDGDDTE